MNTLKKFTLLPAIFFSFFSFPITAQQMYCYHNDWIYLAGGTILGAAAGAGTGYAAGRLGGRRGKTGKTGAFATANTKNALEITGTNEIIENNTVSFSFTLFSPAGIPLLEEIVVTAGDEITPFVLAKETPKLEGTYIINVRVLTASNSSTPLVSFVANQTTFTPAISAKNWVGGEILTLFGEVSFGVFGT